MNEGGQTVEQNMQRSNYTGRYIQQGDAWHGIEKGSLLQMTILGYLELQVRKVSTLALKIHIRKSVHVKGTLVISDFMILG